MGRNELRRDEVKEMKLLLVYETSEAQVEKGDGLEKDRYLLCWFHV